MSITHEEKLRRQQQARSAAAVKPASETLEQMLARLNGINAKFEDFKKKHRAWAAEKFKTPAKCETHGSPKLINWDVSATNSFRSGVMELVHYPCEACEELAKLKTMSSWMIKAGVPENMLHCTFANFVRDTDELRGHHAHAEAFSRKRAGFLILGGAKYGTGKGHLAVANLREAGSGFMITTERLISEIRNSYGKNRASFIRERCENAKLFILDELGFSTGGNDELVLIHGILDHRHGAKKKTIITGNFKNKKEFVALIGPRMADRLSESGYMALWFTGESRRPAQHEIYFGEQPGT